MAPFSSLTSVPPAPFLVHLFLVLFCAVTLQGCEEPEEEANPFPSVFGAQVSLARTRASRGPGIFLKPDSSGPQPTSEDHDDAEPDRNLNGPGSDTSSPSSDDPRDHARSFVQAARDRHERRRRQPRHEDGSMDGEEEEEDSRVDTDPGDVRSRRSFLQTGRAPPDLGGARHAPHIGQDFSNLQVEDGKQQSELEDAYAKMLYLDDPDDVDKAEQVAWMKMQLEDRKFLKGGAGLHNRKKTKEKVPAPLHRTQMLNTHQAPGSLSSWNSPAERPADGELAPASPGGSAMLQFAKSAEGSVNPGGAAPADHPLPKAYQDADLADF